MESSIAQVIWIEARGDCPAKATMRHVALIYNPASGQHSSRRGSVIEKALKALRLAGLEAEAVETDGPGSASRMAQQAVGRGCDTILACGGDGTVHEILQYLVGTPTALGVLPLGTANALAADLGVALHRLGATPARAVERLLASTPTRIPVGRVFYRNSEGAERSRYFVVACGVGADALFLSRLDSRLKRRFGYVMYLIEGLRVWATHSFPLFEANFKFRGNRVARKEAVSQLLAVRIRDFGGVLHNIAPGASLRKETLRLLAFKSRSRVDYLLFLLAVLFRRQSFNGKIELLNALTVECQQRNDSPNAIFVEADGEILGTLPARMEIVAQALTLLIPPAARRG